MGLHTCRPGVYSVRWGGWEGQCVSGSGGGALASEGSVWKLLGQLSGSAFAFL